EQAEQREHALALPRAGLADDAERLAALEIERQALDRVHFAVRRREPHVEIPDFEQRHSSLAERGHAPSTPQRGASTSPPLAAGRSPVLRIERIAQTVAQEVEAEQRRREEDRGEEQHPRRALHLLRAFLHERAPRRHRLLHAEPEEAQEGLDEEHPPAR